MRLSSRALALVLVSTLVSRASAQQTLIVGGQPAPVLRAGQEVPLRTLENLTTEGKHLRVGQRFELETAEAVSLNGQVVIPSGTHGVGEITSIRNKGMWGKSGNIEARVLYLRVGERQIRLSGSFNDKGVTGTAGVVGAIALVPIAGFLVTGTSARVPAGSPVKAFLDEDVPVQFAAGAASAPLTVSGGTVVAAATPVAGTAPAPAAAPR